MGVLRPREYCCFSPLVVHQRLASLADFRRLYGHSPPFPMLTRHFATSKTPTQLPTTQDFTYNLLCLQWLARISGTVLFPCCSCCKLLLSLSDRLNSPRRLPMIDPETREVLCTT